MELNANELRTVKEVLQHKKTYEDVVRVFQIIRRENMDCQTPFLNNDMMLKFGLFDKADALPSILQYFYKLGKEDYIKEERGHQKNISITE